MTTLGGGTVRRSTGGDLADRLAGLAAAAVAHGTNGASGHFGPGSARRGLGTGAAGAHAAAEHAMARLTVTVAGRLAEGCDRTAAAEAAHLRPAGAADGFYVRALRDALERGGAKRRPDDVRGRVWELARTADADARARARAATHDGAAAAVATRHDLAPLAKHLDGAVATPLGTGAPLAVARAARRMVTLGLVAALALSMAVGGTEAKGGGGGGGHAGGSGGHASFGGHAGASEGHAAAGSHATYAAPVMVRPAVGPSLLARIRGWFGHEADPARAAGVPSPRPAGAGSASAAGHDDGGSWRSDGYAYGGPGGSSARDGAPERDARTAVPPGPEVVRAARLVATARMGSAVKADRYVRDVTNQGMACAASGSTACWSVGNGVDFDYVNARYLVWDGGTKVAEQVDGRFETLDAARLGAARAAEAGIRAHDAEIGFGGPHDPEGPDPDGPVTAQSAMAR